MPLDTKFNPAEMEARLYEAWEKGGYFKPGRKPDAEPFTIVIPPPNVTGSLHMGHALNNTIQDITIRFERMRGKDVLWQPGTDHAGIATQIVVERLLAKEGKTSRKEMGREAFVKRVWEWKAESGGIITQQLRRLGASCDWSRERFTMDEGLSAAVRKVFVQLYKQGLIYKDKRLVNWDPVLETAISDLEVETRETKGAMWSFAYPLVDGPVDGISEIVISTTRPETMLGDGAVAVHPSDARYKNLVGKLVRLPIAERHIPIIADDYPDPEFGTGAVKITGAHDENDFHVAKRNNIPLIVLMDKKARMIATPENNVPERYNGIDRYKAREMILSEIEELGFYRGKQEKIIAQPFGDRSNVVIEPMLTEQWYVNAAELAKPAIEAVMQGKTTFVPASWDKTYFQWMNNIQPWCISRQLWWGHQIPVWYGSDDKIYVEESEAAAQQAAGLHVKLTRDEDVLDTWFSSALWPFSTLGWPELTPVLAKHYPTDILVSGFDIIFHWVARMMMMGIHFMGKVPFPTVYMHGLVLDEKGQKMSKVKGNGIDPLDMINEFGADALRFTLASQASQGRDIRFSKARVEGNRNFATKLWNAARFAEMNGVAKDENFDPLGARVTVNRWIAAEASRTRDMVTTAIVEHKYNEAAAALYQFAWNTYCDWYVELVKPILTGIDETAKAETQACAAWAFEQILLLMHPFMPFITEELWDKTAVRRTMLIEASWPRYAGNLVDAAALAEMGSVIETITAIRSVRAEMNVNAGAKIPAVIVGAKASMRVAVSNWNSEIMRLARLSSLTFEDVVPAASAQIALEGAIIALPLEGMIDFAAERVRLNKELEKIAKDMAGIDGRLNNASFVAKAPPEVLEESRELKAALESKKAKLNEALKRLGDAT